MDTRIRQVRAGAFSVGDILDGHRITGFGREWMLDEEESCAWGAGPWERVRVCYAYGERVSEIPLTVDRDSRAALMLELERLDREWSATDRTKVRREIDRRIKVIREKLSEQRDTTHPRRET